MKTLNTNEEIIDFFLVLSNEKSTNNKKSLIEHYKDDVVLQEVFKFLYDNNITTGISSKKISSDKHVDVQEDFNTILEVINYLLENNRGKIYDVCVIKKFVNKLDESYHNTLFELFTKKIKLGITATTLNKIYGDEFIYNHEVQLALVYEDNIEYLEGKDIAITTKLDGESIAVVKFR